MRKLIAYLLLAFFSSCKQPDLAYSTSLSVTNQSVLKAFCKLVADQQNSLIDVYEFSKVQFNNFTFLKVNDKNFATIGGGSCTPPPTSASENNINLNFRPAVCLEEQVTYYDNGLIVFSKKINITIAKSSSLD